MAQADDFDWLSRWVSSSGEHWSGIVDCFAGKVSRWRELGYESAWAILTDLDLRKAEISWYGLRTWIEYGFKDAQTRVMGMAAQQDD